MVEHLRTGIGVYHTSDVVARSIADHLERGPLLLLTDFDGTLSDLAPTPDEAVVLASVRTEFEALGARPGVTLGVISGRRLADVRGRVGVTVDFVSGLHGMEIDGPAQDFRHPALDAAAPIVQEVGRKAREQLAWCPEAILEDKTFALTCHVRRVVDDQTAGRVLSEFVDIVEPYIEAGAMRLLPGSKAFELLPAAQWNKGRAVDWIRDVVEGALERPSAVVYIGDDRTDEDAFAALRPDDIAVGVGDRPHDHLIKFRLAGPASVGRLFAALAGHSEDQSE